MADPGPVVAALEQAWTDALTGAGESSVQVLGENDPPLTPPPDPRAADGSEWSRFTVQFAESELPELNSRLHDIHGVVIVSLFARLGSGTTRLDALAKLAISAFGGLEIDDALCGEAAITFRGASPDNLWYGVNVSTPFQFEHLPA